MPFRKKGSPYWQYDFFIEGRRFLGSTGTENFEEAKNIEAGERRKALTRIKFPEQADISLDDAFGKFWIEHGKHKKSSTDIWRMLSVLKDGIGAGKMLRSMTNSDIADYIGRRRAKISDASVNREIGLLRAVLNRASAVWDIAVKMPNWKAHKLAEPRGRVRSLSAGEETALFKALRPDFHPLVRFCLITGARVSSVRKLTWKSIDMESGLIKLEVKSKITDDFHMLPITPEIESLLASVRGHHPIYVFTYVSAGKVVRKRLKGHRYPFQRDGWRCTWAKALKDAKIDDFRFHDLRHTAATQMLEATKNIAAVQKVLGHRDITTTMRYAHVMQDDIRDALSRKNPAKETTEQNKTQLKIVSSNG